MQTIRNRGHRLLKIMLAALMMLFPVPGMCEDLYIVTPQATGDVAWKDGGVVLDASFAKKGYIMISKTSTKKLKVRISRPDKTYTYDLPGDGEFEKYPLQDGSGSYKVAVYENVKGNSYKMLLERTVKVQLDDEKAAFLCPNRYVKYSEELQVILDSEEWLEGVTDTGMIAENVMEWITQKFHYDYLSALSVQSGYVPDLEVMGESGQGMCFDFASLMCAILRAHGIPVQLVMGDADGIYHAWCSVWQEDEWVQYDPTAAVTGTRIQRYTPEACY